MKTLAEKYENQLDIESIAIQKDQDYENEKTWWIFEDGSALGLDSHQIVYINNNYGLHRDHQKIT